jgi:hypothetical protein
MKKLAIKRFTSLDFKQSKCIDGLYIIENYKRELLYDKPIYIGASILDISKVVMMDFHYNTIHKNFENNYNLIYSDTDSLIYSIKHDDIYEFIKDNKQYFDLSDSIRPDLKDNTNEKIPGKFKDEMNSLLIKEVVALNPKVYSIIHQSEKDGEIIIENSKKCKGVSKLLLKMI